MSADAPMLVDVENTIKNIVREIMRECTNKGIKVYENFVTYYVKLLILDPEWGITLHFTLDRIIVQYFVKHCLVKLGRQHCAQIMTMKIQMHFTHNYERKEAMVVRNRIDLTARLNPLEKEIIEAEGDEKESVEQINKKMVYYITLLSGLGNPTIPPVYLETELALRSILTGADLDAFINQPKSNKEAQLVELTELVTGIRLFNRDCKKGGQGIEDLPNILSHALEAANNDLQRTLVVIMDKVNMLTTAVDNCFKTVEENGEYHLHCELPEDVTVEEVEYTKDLLVFYRQYEVYARKILAEVAIIEVNASDIFEELQASLVKLHDTVRFRTAIPTVQVFPLFSELSQIWCRLQDETILLARLNQILENLHLYSKLLARNDQVLKLLIGSSEIMTDADRLEKTTGLTITCEEECDVEFLEPSQFKEFDKVPLQFLGFCAWKLIETQGGLIPGNASMGVAKVNDLFYVFSSPQAASAFARDPDKCIKMALYLARKKPELINFLDLQDQLKAVQTIGELVPKPLDVIVTYDAEIQTETHPVESKIDPDYMWNIWDWKRQAILLANISKCMTKSTQTEQSNAKGAVRLQTYDPKDQIIQTKKDNYSNVPTVSNFIYGLRGRKDDIQHIITLTRPVDE